MTDWNKLRQVLNPTSGSSALIDGYASMGNYGVPVGGMPIDTAALQTMPAVAGQPSLFSGLFDNFLSSTKNGVTTQGWGGMALGALQGLGNAYMSMKNYGLGRDSLDQAKREFDMNWGAQTKMVNSQLEDRQRARVASNPGAYQSVGDYMKQYAVGG